MRWLLVALVFCSGCDLVIGVGEDEDYCRVTEQADGGMCRRLAPQCGCESNETCGLSGMCQPAGALPRNAVCTPGMNECAQGLECAGLEGVAAGNCRELCVSGSLCEGMGPGSFCFETDAEANSISVCTVSCTPGESTECAPGTFCVGVPLGTLCVPEGPAAVGEPCEDEDCQAPAVCLPGTDGNLCRQPCGPRFDACPGGQQCAVGVGSDRRPVSGDEYGYCARL